MFRCKAEKWFVTFVRGAVETKTASSLGSAEWQSQPHVAAGVERALAATLRLVMRVEGEMFPILPLLAPTPITQAIPHHI
jgi:hypothetical protein